MIRRRRACRTLQQGLFHPATRTPEWRKLPVEAQRDVTRLIARLLRGHRERAQRHADTVAGEESDD
jgi:hypothetical protein